jgi:hypothetical protein
VHRLDRGLARLGTFLLHDALDVLQHDDRVVDDDADRSTMPNSVSVLIE